MQASRFRTWWLFPTVVIAGAIESVGWAFRLISSYNLNEQTPFIIQYVPGLLQTAVLLDFNSRITLLIVGPTPFVAALFIGFGRVAERLGAEYSRLSPKLCELFVSSSCLGCISTLNIDSRIFLTGVSELGTLYSHPLTDGF